MTEPAARGAIARSLSDDLSCILLPDLSSCSRPQPLTRTLSELQKQNGDGHEAITGIDGDKRGPEAWDAPINFLRIATDDAGLEAAMIALEKASPADVDKAVLVQTGMTKKKLFGDKWPKDRFMALVKQF